MIARVPFAAIGLAVLVAAGLAEAALGALAVRRFAQGPARSSTAQPPVTILKPLHGDEPLLHAALESFFRQDYPRYQLVFGVHNASDPAIAIVRRLAAQYPERDVALVIDGTRHGLNRKIGNLINMLPCARHDLLVLADSDVHAAPDCLTQLVACLVQPGTGAATALYSARRAAPGLAAALGASAIDHLFLPGVLLASALGRQDCLGATLAIRRSTLHAIGGLPALADQLADDAVLGRLVRHQGLAVRLAATVPQTTVPEGSLRALVQHEMRWACTIRALAPLGHAGSLLRLPIAWALLAVLLSAAASWSLALLAAAWIGRALAARTIDRTLALPGVSPLLLPLRDLLSMAEILASYVAGRVRWRGEVVPLRRTACVMQAARPRRASGLRCPSVVKSCRSVVPALCAKAARWRFSRSIPNWPRR